jgi:hypothetical protein
MSAPQKLQHLYMAVDDYKPWMSIDFLTQNELNFPVVLQMRLPCDPHVADEGIESGADLDRTGDKTNGTIGVHLMGAYEGDN